jgi:ABC-type histidine transport system ATPase subunit
MHKIEVQNLKKDFHEHPVLTGVSFAAMPGEVVALLGGSGAGKSTLLRCLNLLDQPDAGKVRINGLSFEFPQTKVTRKELVLLRSKVGMVFQQLHLWAHMTILQNLIEAPMQILKLTKAQAIEKAEHLLSQLGILQKKNQFPAQLSGGQQQRVAIARALMMEPEVMLFDEPTSSLDPQNIMAMVKLIQSLAEGGMTVVVATHEMKFAQELAHKTIFLHAGQILEEGETKKMFGSPQTPIFQQFIASVGIES